MIMTGGQIVVEALIRARIERLYCVPGESFLAVIDAMFDVQDKISQVTCRHESGAAMMALAEAELLGRPSACFVTRGPGATNASIAVHMAHQASLPLILFIGQVSRDLLGREAFQEIDYQNFYGGITKAVYDIHDPDEISTTIATAFNVAQQGRPGPVVVVLPEDVLAANGSQQVERLLTPEVQPVLDQSQLATLQRLLCAAEKPLIIAGGPMWSDHTANALTELAERSLTPVTTAFRRNDAVDNFSPCFAGYLGLNQHNGIEALVATADLIVVLGARLDEPTTTVYNLPGLFHDHACENFTWAHIHPSFRALPGCPKAPLQIEASASSVIDALGGMSWSMDDEHAERRQSWYSACRQQYEDSLKDPFKGKYADELLDLPKVMAELNELLDEEAIITTDAGNFTVWPQRLRQYRRPGRLLAPINGAMGFGIPSGIAASLAFPESTVVSFVGDGGMLMTGQELSTAVKYGAKPIIIIFNNALYGTIDTHQRRQYPGREHGNELSNPNFASFAESFGVAGVSVRNVPDFANAFLQAKQLDELAVIELMLH